MRSFDLESGDELTPVVVPSRDDPRFWEHDPLTHDLLVMTFNGSVMRYDRDTGAPGGVFLADAREPRSMAVHHGTARIAVGRRQYLRWLDLKTGRASARPTSSPCRG